MRFLVDAHAHADQFGDAWTRAPADLGSIVEANARSLFAAAGVSLPLD